MKNKYILIFIFIFIFSYSNNLFAWPASESNYSIFTTYRYIYTDSGTSYRVFSAPEKYYTCERHNRIKRGEYETKKEFAIRKKLQSSSCDLYKKIHNAKIIVSSKLKYNVDKGFFLYKIGAGSSYYKCNGDFANAETHVQFEFDKNKKIKMDKKYIDHISVHWHDGKANDYIPGHITIKMFSPVEKARLLKVIENSLELRIYGDFHWYYLTAGKSEWQIYTFTVKHIVLFNKEENKPIFIIE